MQLVQISRRPFSEGKDSNKSKIRSYYCNKKDHNGKECLRKRIHDSKQPPSRGRNEKSGKPSLLSE